jgi:hypothetical protein
LNELTNDIMGRTEETENNVGLWSSKHDYIVKISRYHFYTTLLAGTEGLSSASAFAIPSELSYSSY